LEGAVWALAEVCHRRHVLPLAVCGLLEAHVEEFLVELFVDERLSAQYIGETDWRGRCSIPCLLAIGLDEGGVAARLVNDLSEGVILPGDARRLSGSNQRPAGC
jgi:hypothetical protein